MRTLSFIRAPALGTLIWALPGLVVGAQPTTGTITGRTTEAANGSPLVAVQVSVVGTTLGTQTSIPIPQSEENNPKIGHVGQEAICLAEV